MARDVKLDPSIRHAMTRLVKRRDEAINELIAQLRDRKSLVTRRKASGILSSDWVFEIAFLGDEAEQVLNALDPSREDSKATGETVLAYYESRLVCKAQGGMGGGPVHAAGDRYELSACARIVELMRVNLELLEGRE